MCQVGVDLFVNFFGGGLRHVCFRGVVHFESDQWHFAECTNQVEVTISTEEKGFTLVTKVVLLRQVTFLNRLYNIVTLVDDGVILTPVGFYQSVAGVVLKIIVHRSLIGPVTGGTSFFRIFRTEIFDGKGGDTGGDVIITHHGVNVEDLSFGKCSGIIVFGKLSLWVTVQKIVATAEAQSRYS